MKKSVLLFFIFFASGIISVQGAINSQARVLSDFFKKHGSTTIAIWAHPLSTYFADKTIITANANNVTVKIFYSRLGNKYNCTYYLEIKSNYISSLKILTEGYSNYPCFSTCKTITDLQNKITIYKGDSELVKIVEGLSHKLISAFECQDYCLLGLNYYWKGKGFMNKYKNGGIEGKGKGK